MPLAESTGDFYYCSRCGGRILGTIYYRGMAHDASFRGPLCFLCAHPEPCHDVCPRCNGQQQGER